MNPQLLQALLAALAQGQAQGQAGQAQPPAGAPANPLQAIFGPLLGGQPAAGAPAINPLQLIFGALLGNQPAGTNTGTVPPILSPIDRMLGGEALAGKKTVIAVVGFAILAIANPAVLAGGAAAVGAPAIIATLLKGFGALGLLAKFDRVVQALGLIAANPAAPAVGEVVKKILPVVLPQILTPAIAGKTLTLTGRMSTFGGPADTGVAPNEGLALMDENDLSQFQAYFLPQQPPGTTGMARRLDPTAAYIACRWDYSRTPKNHLRAIKVQVINANTGQQESAQPVDWGPAQRTDRIADLSPGLAQRLGLDTNDMCTVVIPL